MPMSLDFTGKAYNKNPRVWKTEVCSLAQMSKKTPYSHALQKCTQKSQTKTSSDWKGQKHKTVQGHQS